MNESDMGRERESLRERDPGRRDSENQEDRKVL